ncbi:hypothetical protein P153DRAFT_390294 [Dothidotthia symphoricarpi CBS 119687]|uniref:Uncharacterized protein n=1 Tax=Dothidotthia symphoricarpi CBS 119687 TaxID=1392245 RepID=A0A6A6A1K0_9PLEO|nr:uncharacterized protein P153DRAFT_390294 [Dothidotthia symphoricarpi CBS 119687]KAF2124827.1 hypothetical protein P153DRAFT_390294 [Dothidotthia symphoricarpi CBS 119687]
MRYNENRELGGICGYCKSRHEARQRKTSSSELVVPGCEHAYGIISKPPQLQFLHERPRNRLRKRISKSPSARPLVTLYVLEYESYPYNTRPSEFLGVYSTIDSVTAGAFRHGAHSFSREGLIDGSQYLSLTGRLRIVPTRMQQDRVAAAMPDEAQSLTGEVVRPDIPHPEYQSFVRPWNDAEEKMYLAIHQEPQAAFCIGLFTKKSTAWDACLESEASYALSNTLHDETRQLDSDGLPSVTARLTGGSHRSWFVASYTLNA